MLQTITSGAVPLLVHGFILTSLASESYNLSEFHRIRRQSQNEEKAGCKLPPPQQNGKFSPSRQRCPPDNDVPLCQMTPGNLVPHNWPLFHSCDLGYALNTTKTASVCLDGQWRPALPGCVRPCPPLKDPELRLRCVYREREVSCDSDMRPGTVAGAACPQYYRTSSEKLCLDDGNWTKLNRSAYIETQMVPGNTNFTGFRCVPECGLSLRKDDTSTEVTSPSEYPWMAFIYKKNYGNSQEFLGILITARYVISTSYDFGYSKAEDLRVGLGKIHRDIFGTETGSSVIYEVKKVIVGFKVVRMLWPPSENIVLLRLSTDAQVSANVMPVCIDWRQIYTPATNSTITMAGLIARGTSDSWTTSDRIQPRKFRYVRKKDCKEKYPNEIYLEHIPNDNSCIENIDDVVEFYIRPGYEIKKGSGLTYKVENRHFLIGYVLDTCKLNNDREILFAADLTLGSLLQWLKEGLMTGSS